MSRQRPRQYVHRFREKASIQKDTPEFRGRHDLGLCIREACVVKAMISTDTGRDNIRNCVRRRSVVNHNRVGLHFRLGIITGVIYGRWKSLQVLSGRRCFIMNLVSEIIYAFVGAFLKDPRTWFA